MFHPNSDFLIRQVEKHIIVYAGKPRNIIEKCNNVYENLNLAVLQFENDIEKVTCISWRTRMEIKVRRITSIAIN